MTVEWGWHVKAIGQPTAKCSGPPCPGDDTEVPGGGPGATNPPLMLRAGLVSLYLESWKGNAVFGQVSQSELL